MFQINKKSIAESFNRAASTYDSGSEFQKAAGEFLLKETVQLTKNDNPKVIIDLGSGTGTLTKKISFFFPESNILCIDIALRMLQHAKNINYKNNIKLISADADLLPFPKSSCDLVFSNLLLQWSPCFKTTIREVRRILKPNGWFLFSILGPKTLYELRHCWQQADQYQHVISFPSFKKIYQDIRTVQYQTHLIKIKTYTDFFDQSINVMKKLKMTGARNVYGHRRSGLYTKHILQIVLEEYEQFRNIDGKLPLTYETYFFALKICSL